MRRSLLFCTTAALILLSATSVQLHAQGLIQALAADSLGERPFLDMESAFLRWSREHDLTKTKGWKWYARWEWFNRTGLGFKQTQGDASLIRRVFVDTEDSRRLVAAGIGGIWTSSDGGDSWSSRSKELIWDIERNPTTPSTLYASTGDVRVIGINRGQGGIVRSDDFGATWTPMTTTIPGKQVTRIELAISRSDPRIVYAIAAGLDGGFHSLHRTTNDGGSWEERASRGSIPNILEWEAGKRREDRDRTI